MANVTITGLVERVMSFPGKFGDMFSILVDGDRYGTGKNSMGANEGDYVTFIAAKNGKGYWEIEKGTMKPATPPAGATKPAPASNSTGNTSHGDSRQDSIVFQSSRKDALHFVEILSTLGLIEFGRAKGADKVAILETYLDRFTDHFIDECKKTKTFASQDAEHPDRPTQHDDLNDEIPF